jgi:hypothetical protein
MDRGKSSFKSFTSKVFIIVRKKVIRQQEIKNNRNAANFFWLKLSLKDFKKCKLSPAIALPSTG